MPPIVTAEGRNLEKPSENFRAEDHTTSKSPAIVRYTHGIPSPPFSQNKKPEKYHVIFSRAFFPPCPRQWAACFLLVAVRQCRGTLENDLQIYYILLPVKCQGKKRHSHKREIALPSFRKTRRFCCFICRTFHDISVPPPAIPRLIHGRASRLPAG